MNYFKSRKYFIDKFLNFFLEKELFFLVMRKRTCSYSEKGMVVVLVYAWIASHTLVQMQFPEPNSSEAQVEPRLASKDTIGIGR